MNGSQRSNAQPVVFMASLVVLLAGCSQDAIRAPDESPVAATVAQELGAHRFLKVHSEQNAQGYTIESGNLAEPLKGRIDGSLVVVTDQDGEITAIIDSPERRGTLHVDKAGVRRFLEEPPYDYLKPDSVAGPAESASASAANTPDNTGEIDALVLFSTKALAVLNADPVAFALAQLETANLGLRNSLVGGVQLRLAGVRVTETDLPVDGSGLTQAQNMLTPLRSEYLHDINVGYFDNSPYGGMAFVPGWSSVNSIYHPMAFRHEVGHNAGGDHCNEDGQANYRFGYQTTGGAHTFLCGNSVPYYSNPQVTYEGVPLGDPGTADMAKLWREQASRLAGYSPAFEGTRLFMSSHHREVVRVMVPGMSGTSGFVALTSDVGPVKLEPLDQGGFSILTVELTGPDGTLHPVNLRGLRELISCSKATPINSYINCSSQKDIPQLYLLYMAIDNPELPPGWYNGVLRLKALDHSNSAYEHSLLISLALRKS